ncbi:MAG: glycosyltransferase family 4 protein [Patescibacteria group bacterium]
MTRQRLLFITPKIHERDDDFAFTSLWARAFANAGFDVTVICTEKREHSLPFPVYSLGREEGLPRWRQFLRLQKLLMTLKYDRVFVHMSAVYLASGAWWWALRRIPTYLWYTHYTKPWYLTLGAPVVKRMFAAMSASLPQFDGDPRKIVTGHGIDTDFWNVPAVPEEEREPATHLLAVHRISQSKRLHLVLRALALLPKEYTLTHYGRPQDPRYDPAYEQEIRSLINSPELVGRVRLMGAVPMPELRAISPRYRVVINMVPKTIDKSVLEAMYCGCTPVIARDHAEAIGYPDAPKSEDPKDIADFILHLQLKSREELRQIIDEKHSLPALVERMAVYIRAGN